MYTTVRVVNPDYSDVKPDAVANPTSITLPTVAKLYGDARSWPSRHWNVRFQITLGQHKICPQNSVVLHNNDNRYRGLVTGFSFVTRYHRHTIPATNSNPPFALERSTSFIPRLEIGLRASRYLTSTLCSRPVQDPSPVIFESLSPCSLYVDATPLLRQDSHESSIFAAESKRLNAAVVLSWGKLGAITFGGRGN